MTDRRLRDLWNSLSKKKPHMPHFLKKVILQDIRGIDDLEVKFEYPVSVLAGGNGSGKSTVLFAAACAYARPGTGVEELSSGFTPFAFFLDYRSKWSGPEDEKGAYTIQFEYSTPDGQRLTVLQCPKTSMGVTFIHMGDDPPERWVHVIAPENLIDPSDMYYVHHLSFEMAEPQETLFTSPQIAFAQRLLPFGYSRIADLSHPNLKFDNKKNLLLAEQENGVVYSEPHMAAGERAILRLSRRIPQTKGGLVLIDEVETGLHPSIQKSLMLELQQLALRNDLQIIVTTHSPVVLDSVPEIGRIFLDRNEEGKIVVHPPYRDLIQDALYGCVDEKFNLLCEDNAAQGVLEGVFDIIIPRLLAKRDSIRIDRDTGADEFPRYARMLKRCGQIQNFIFVLDGDQQDEKVKREIISVFMDDKKNRSEEEKEQDRVKYQGRVVLLPGAGAPEAWVWHWMREFPDNFATGLGIDLADLVQQIKRLDADHDSVAASASNIASNIVSNIAKTKLHELSQIVNRTVPDICRIVSCRETEREDSDIQPLVKELMDAFQAWRSGT